MSKLAATIKAPALKSQIAVMAGTVSNVTPQSHLARFVFGELKGGEHKHDFAMGVIHSAIEQALKGNQRDIPETVKLCTGKSVKARAYLAGFHVIADSVKPMTYTGKLADACNVLVRQQIVDHARAMACEFEVAYLATIENAKIEAAFARKAKAKTAPVVGAPASESANDETAPAVATAPTIDATVMDVVGATISAIQAGMLSAEELEMLRVALAIAEPVALAA